MDSTGSPLELLASGWEAEQVRAAYIKDYDILNWGKTWKPQQ